MGLIASRNTKRYDAIIYPTRLDLPVEASTHCYGGGLAVIDASGYAAPGSAALGLKAVGRFEKDVDNSAGAAAAVTAPIECGAFLFANGTAGDAIAQANAGQPCYIIDDQTVGLTDGSATRSFAGTILGMDPDGSGQVVVLVGLVFGAPSAAPKAVQKGTTTLVSGVSPAITAELTATSVIVASLKTSAGTVTSTINYAALSTDRNTGAQTFKVSAVKNDGTVDTTDTSVVDWIVVN